MTSMTNAVTQPGTSSNKELKKRVITDLVAIKATADQTGDSVTVLEIETPPGGGCPPHVQRYDDESIYVLEGSYSLLVGDVQEDVAAGTARFVGRGTLHGYVNPGPGVARMLVHLFPGGIHERFIDEAGDEPERPMWEANMANVIAVAPAFGIEFETEKG